MAEEVQEKKENKAVEELKKNPWIVATFAFAIVSLVLLFFVSKGGMTGNVISENDIGSKAVDFINTQLLQGQGAVTLDSISEKAGLYEVNVLYNNQKIPVYFTKDGEYYVGTTMAPLTADASASTNVASTTPKQVPKSDKPVVDAFIFSYCPYGLQFEKALLPVYTLLKNKADINIVAIGAMHGEFEHQESLRQISIQQLYSKDKLFAYLQEFDTNTNIGSCNGDAACLIKYLPAIYAKLGIDGTKIDSYMKTSAQAIYDEQGAQANSLGVSGSPTFVINGVEVQVGRTADAIKTAICSAFNTAPSECSQNVSSDSPSAGFGGSSSASASSAASAASCG